MALTTRLGWLGAVAYALPILEVWLLTRLSDRGATALLVALQALWVLALVLVVVRCVRGSRAFRAAVAAQAAEREDEERVRVLAEAQAQGYSAGARDAAGTQARRAARPRSLRSSADRRRSHR